MIKPDFYKSPSTTEDIIDMLSYEVHQLKQTLKEIKELVDTIPMGGSKEGRPDYCTMVSGDKVARLRELTK